MDKVIKDYTIGGALFTSWYILCTAIFPNIVLLRNRIFIKMNKIQVTIWFFLTLAWQLQIIYSINYVINNKDDTSEQYKKNKNVYDLFITGGWYNFQKWISSYAENIWDDIIILSIVLILPLNVFGDLSRLNKFQLVFTKIGFFYVFLFFILGPPKYEFKKHHNFTIRGYLNRVLKFKDINKNDGIIKYLLHNRLQILKIISSFSLLALVLFIS